MSEDAVERAIARIVDAGLADLTAIRGCTTQEIGQIESQYGIVLPDAYRRFLTRIGSSAGQFLIGTDWSFPAPLHLRETAETIIADSNANFALGAGDFVFLGHQGYQVLFFDTGASDDPAVLRFIAGDREPSRVFDRFSCWLATCVEDEIAAFNELHR